MSEKEYKDHLYALIMAGGGGTRLWPKSRNATPKQFLKLFGKKTLMEITAERIRKFLPWERIFVSTTKNAYAKEIKKLVPQMLVENIIIEPERKDSGPAHALGAIYIERKDPDAVIVNAASDALLEPDVNYKNTMYAAAETAYGGSWLVAVGFKPSFPHTGMGHIKKGKQYSEAGGKKAFILEKFVEKPPLDLAKKYTSSGEYYWNANQYVWRADTFLKAIEKHAPKINKYLNLIKPAIGKNNELKVLKEYYAKMPKISVDYAVSEKASNFLLLIADYNWTDVGDWKEVWKNLPKDNQGNVVIDGDEPGGEIINMGTSDALIHTDGRLIALIDVDNIVVVDTKNAILICSKSKAQNVKKIVQQLKKENKIEYL